MSSKITGMTEARIPRMHYICHAMEKLNFICVHLNDVLKLFHSFPPSQEYLNTLRILIQLAVLYLVCYWR